MKLGLGLYRDRLNKDNYQFAKQAGCTHIVAHLVDYYNGVEGLPSTDKDRNMGIARPNEDVWSYESLMALKKSMNDEGLEFEAIENFSPADWYDILMDGPKKTEQMDNLKRIVCNVGKAGIPIIGYNFSIAGVWGHVNRAVARGGAVTATFNLAEGPEETPIPNGQIWNMTYDFNAPKGYIPAISSEELWQRLDYFLKELVPVAEEAGVRLAAHPDDPPMSTIRGYGRLVNQPRLYQKLLDIVPSRSNALEFCLGTLQEMTEGNIYETIDQYSKQNAVGYVHFRNVKGKVPNYQEVFVDEGDIDMIQALRIFKKNNFDGVFIPDHTPQMTCKAPWHAGMAYALGYMKAALAIVNNE
ncbi:mannonate dehydratase [Paenibacillus aceris]|uniref:mannonate dehydratase n=1 Tax=Paenibacillus aceris TaxID=869555 RepID=A0ABS4I206_9BACL|nr:mannonate dehydratase [Paenibacillus aceris]MBP1964948.1 mannonate dehydratase [Paenibacillus aceris]NHW35609.1 TIM barrel protein [Paenibacillus aceris]